MKIIITSLIGIILILSSLVAGDITGSGYGSTKEEARANAIYDIKTQIIVEQESYTEIKTTESNGKESDSFSMLITEYSRNFPLEQILYKDSEDKTKNFGENWHSTAIVSEDSYSLYQNKLREISNEIREINNNIVNATSSVKNISWQKALLDLCYDFLNYRLIVKQLNPSAVVPDLPISVNRVRLEYEDMKKRERNEIETGITSLSLLLAYGDLDDKGIEQLKILQDEYKIVSNNLNQLSENRGASITYSTTEYSSNEPATASDYLLRIESNRKAFSYYRNSPINFESKLSNFSEQAISDLDKISETIFKATSNTEDLSFEVLKYSVVNEGWIGRATILLGGETLQFSFLIPYEGLVGSSFNDITFNRWDVQLSKNPEKYITLNISYNVTGSFIGNEYGFTVKTLDIEKIIDPKTGEGFVIYKAANKNPKTIIFNYGTAVDLGDVGIGDEAKVLRAKANKKTKTSEKPEIYILTELGALGGLPFDSNSVSNSDESNITYGGIASAEIGVLLQNNKQGREKIFYGFGLNLGFSFANQYVSIINDISTIDSLGTSYEISGSGFYAWPLDGTLDNYIKLSGSAGYGFGYDSYYLCNLGVAYSHTITEKLSVFYNVALRLQFGSFIDIGLKPSIGLFFGF